MSAAISAALVKELREKTGAGMMDCKGALQEANGDVNGAIEILRKKGLKDLGKRAGKIAAEGTVGIYVHAGSQVGVLVELNCETDFVARGEDFQKAAAEIALHVAAMKPKYVTTEEIPSEIVKKEEEIIIESLNDAQKAKADKIIPGKLKKFFEECVLLEQPFVKDDSGKKTVRDIIEELGVKCGEKVTIRRFQRFEVGEGIEKSSGQSFADEVAATIASG
ncbi:translation elongation factor Ts [bacterium]|nr:translation elongation factor Ts [bacterium]